MARARAADNLRSKPKGAQIEDITDAIDRFHEILEAINDFGQEGFPYRDAAQTKAELQLRETVRRIFGERSNEFQSCKNFKLSASTKAEVSKSVSVIKQLIKTLEDKKLELQGLKPPAPEPPEETAPSPPPKMTLVPPAAQMSTGSHRINQPSSTTISVSMTTNLQESQSQAPVVAPAKAPASPPDVPLPTRPQAAAPPPVPPAPLSSALREPEPTQPPPTIPPPLPLKSVPVRPEPEPAKPAPSLPPVSTSVPRTDTPQSSAVPPSPPPSVMSQPPAEVRSAPSTSESDPLQLLRKVCLRFHAVARQLRLRKDYRPTLEVEDEYDLQDMLCALLKLEFDEVGTDEWTPPYTGGASRTTLFLNKDQIAVVAKKTRSGLSAKELADQVTADSSYFRAQDKCSTLFIFIYDPEGRIGSPKRLETNLTSVSERCTVEVLVAPK